LRLSACSLLAFIVRCIESSTSLLLTCEKSMDGSATLRFSAELAAEVAPELTSDRDGGGLEKRSSP
jgi:hypothetical protein